MKLNSCSFHFEKISLNSYIDYFKKSIGEELTNSKLDIIIDEWERIKLPRRATSGSAGYDFFATSDIILKPNCPITVPTGIRWVSDNGCFLLLVPRSGLGFKRGFKLVNTAGVIDSDYYKSDNEGHIMAKFYTDKNVYDGETVICSGEAFMQGIVLPFMHDEDEIFDRDRNGGFGSTDN